MNIENLDLNLLRVFDAVYREQNLSRAANRLGLSQPGISQALNRLRESAGDPLFVRQPHGVAPTAYSDAIAGPIRQALEGLSAALRVQAARDIRATDRRIKVAMSDYSESLILAPLVRLLDEQAPRIKLRTVPLDSLDLRAALLKGQVDLVIGGIAQLMAEHRHQDLFTESFVCIARSGHPGIASSLTLDDFARLRHVGIAVRAAQVSQFDEICQSMGFTRRMDVVVPNFLSIPFIVAATDCIATMPRRLLRLAPPHLGLQVFAPPIDVPTPTICQFWPERAHQDSVCRWLREQIRRICQSL